MTDTPSHALADYAHAVREGAPGAPLFLTFHGTGGDEAQFHNFAAQLMPGARIVSPRGDVSENGAARFFRRTGEGVYDMADLARATGKMAGFIEAAKTPGQRVIGLGYSNGANILTSVALARPDLVDDLILMHPLIPWGPEPQPGLASKRVLITAGRRDPICPPVQTDALALYLERQGAEVTLIWHDGGHEIAQSEVEAVQAFLA